VRGAAGFVQRGGDELGLGLGNQAPEETAVAFPGAPLSQIGDLNVNSILLPVWIAEERPIVSMPPPIAVSLLGEF
jgi:hypothetical protein